MHALSADRIDRDRKRQCRVDTARESDDDAGEAVLRNVVVHAQNEGTIDTFLIDKLRGDLAGVGRDASGCIASEFGEESPFGKGRRARRQHPRRVHDKRIAVEHELILASHAIHVSDRQVHFLDMLAHDLFALALLMNLVG